VPGWPDRLVDVHVPLGYESGTVWPVVVAFHGGGGNRGAGIRTTCPGGDLDDPGCLDNLGDRAGFFTLSPDGTSIISGGPVRTWNAGGTGDLDCVAGYACATDADDIGYVRDLLDMLQEHYSIETRVIVTGLSNGGAMAHRLGCELADRVRVVAAVAGANQNPGCVPAEPISVLHIHGTADGNWPFEGGTLGRLANDARVTGAEATIADWATTLGCGDFVEQAIADAADDGMTSSRRDAECASGQHVTMVVVDGGGHTWPQGHQFAPVASVGGTTQDFNANELIWEFALEADS
jgi:polyhydroxybutyrate depolymerase